MAKNPRLIDLSGRTFGRWTVGFQAGNTPRGGAVWTCRCACGVERGVVGSDLRSGKSVSCGCEGSRATMGARARTHGASDTRLYAVWQNMKARCDDVTNPHYGGRGISVCEEWRDFAAFQAWSMSSGYSNELTIERRDVNGGYEPGNCCWVLRPLQAKNKTTSVKAPDGRLWKDVAIENGISAAAFRCRTSAAGWAHEKAATTPMGARAPGPRGSNGQFLKVAAKAWRR